MGVSTLLIKNWCGGGSMEKNVLSGHCIKEKGMRPFPHRCFAHWPESSGVTGNGVTDSAESRSTEDCVRLSSGC